jgi:prevent-host-death family protein
VNRELDLKSIKANIAIMSKSYNLYNLHPSQDLASAPASELKNAFKGVFNQAMQNGAVSITRNRKREAILLSAELYDQMITEIVGRDPLETLRKDYEARFSAMQTDKAKTGYEDAFNATSADLGKTAVDQAAGQ